MSNPTPLNPIQPIQPTIPAQPSAPLASSGGDSNPLDALAAVNQFFTNLNASAVTDWLFKPLRIIKMVGGLILIGLALVVTFLPEIGEVAAVAAGQPELAPAVGGLLKGRPKRAARAAAGGFAQRREATQRARATERATERGTERALRAAEERAAARQRGRAQGQFEGRVAAAKESPQAKARATRERKRQAGIQERIERAERIRAEGGATPVKQARQQSRKAVPPRQRKLREGLRQMGRPDLE